MLDIAGGTPGPVVTESLDAHLPRREPVMLRRQRLAAMLGHEIPAPDVEAMLTGLGMEVATTADGWSVGAPPARFDIAIEADLVEEGGRLYGYDRIPEVPGDLTTTLGRRTETAVPLERARATLVARGYREAITYSFIDPESDRDFGAAPAELTLANPISADLAVMRQSLWPGLVQALKHNLNRQQPRVRLFESGIRFFQQDADIIEENVLSGLIAGNAYPEQWDAPPRAVDFFDLKADLESMLALTGASDEFEFVAAEHPALRPGRAAQIVRAKKVVGWCGELHPSLIRKLQLAETPMLFELIIDVAFAAGVTEYLGISKFPAVRRDVAVIVGQEIPVAELEKCAREAAGATLRDVVIFDIFAGKNIETGYRSVALGLILQDTSRTLEDAAIDRIVGAVTERLARDCKATIRE
ncbi:MAG: phenylalanine--tRNA ligase subunit beta [Gammaproteobacteria bacterium]